MDDHTILRETVRKRLQLEADLEVVGEAQDGRQAVTLAKTIRPAVLLMDPPDAPAQRFGRHPPDAQSAVHHQDAHPLQTG